MDSNTLSTAIRAAAAGYISRGYVSSVREINAGLCHDFADDVLRLFEENGTCTDATDIGLDTVGIANFLLPAGEGENFNDGYPLDRALLTAHWPAVQPPDGLDWDDLDCLSQDAAFNAGTHSWITFEGRHYDAETPDGVDSPFELEFFKRVIASWLIEGPQAPAQRAAGVAF